MTERFLTGCALALIVFAVAEYEGSNLKVLTGKKLLVVCLIFFLGQAVAMSCGYLIARLPLLSDHVQLQSIYSRIVAAGFLIISAFIFYRAYCWMDREERLRELLYKRIAFEAVAAAFYTLVVGVACGMLGVRADVSFLTVFLCTIVAVIAGLYTGYAQGDRFHRLSYSISGMLFAVTGVELIIRMM